jgi:DNA-directed RNA polymerase specialized sigma24 family protein
MRQGWGWMPPEIQNGWREMMQGATPERRAEIQAKMQALPPEEKAAFRRQLVEEYLKTKAAKK